MVRTGCVALLTVILGCRGSDSVAPPISSPPQAVPPSVSGRVVIVAAPVVAVPGATFDLRARVYDAVDQLAPNRQVQWSAVPEGAVRFAPVIADSSGLARITLVHPGTVQISATADGLVATLTINVLSAPPVSAALVVERFVLQKFPDGPDADYFMPQVTLREPTGRAPVELIGVSASVPTAPALTGCTTSRVWAAGMSADAFGLSYGDPDFGFGPFSERDFPLGPVTLVLTFREIDGTISTISLSRIMTSADIVTGPLEQSRGRSIACP